MPFHLQAKTILQNTRQIRFILMEALPLRMGPTIKSNIFSKCLVTHLFGLYFFNFYFFFNFRFCFLFLFCFEESVCFCSCLFVSISLSVNLSLETSNTKPIMNLPAPQCVLKILCVVLVNKETHLYTQKRERENKYIKSFHYHVEGFTLCLNVYFSPSRNCTFALINIYSQAQ